MISESRVVRVLSALSSSLLTASSPWRVSVAGLALLLGLSLCCASLFGQTATTTALSVTSSGTAVTSVSAGSVVTLTASVQAGGAPVTTGQVNFCDAAASYCSDIHWLGTAQLTSSGTAVYRFRPGLGSHSYSAVFAGTNAASGSTSAAVSLSVTGSQPIFGSSMAIAKSGSWGQYALTGTVTEVGGTTAPTGTISFLDTSNSNAVLGTGSLGAGTLGWTWLASSVTLPLSPEMVAVGDFNEDGIPDVAVSVARNNEVAVLLGNGDGTFTRAAASPATGSAPLRVVVADFNQDGHQDLAIVNTSDDTVTILLGHGDGTFTAGPSLTAGLVPIDMATGDFNGDGIPDLAVVNSFGNTVSIFLGRGDGSFTLTSSPSAGNSPRAIAVGDFNGDGKKDLAITSLSVSTITILLGNGDGTFTSVAGPSSAGYADSIAAADLNGDGKLDLAVGNFNNVQGTNTTISVLLGNGDGTFTAVANSPVVSSPADMVITDVNHDGIPDIVASNYVGWGAAVLLGNGDGTFQAALETHAPVSSAPSDSPVGVAAGDFNGDGRMDLVVANQFSSTLSILLTEPTQTASTPAVTVLPGAPGQHLVDASFPGDSNYQSSTSATTLLWGQPATTATALAVTASGAPVTTVSANTVVSLTASVTVGGSPLTTGQVNFCDATAASCTDIFLVGSAQLTSAGTASFSFVPGSGSHQYKAVFIENAGGVTSTSPTVTLTVQAPPPVASPTITSIAQSGLIGNYTLTGTVSGTGGTQPLTGSVSFEDTSYANAVLATVPIVSSSPGVTWQPSFTNPVTNVGFMMTAAGDFNGDGILDFAVANAYNGQTLTIYLGNGDGTYRTISGPTLTSYPTAVVAADFNGDGKTDLAISSITSCCAAGSLTLFLGNGDGTFTQVPSAPTVAVSPNVFAAADINGDGKLDLIVNDSTGTRILLGNGDGTFVQGAVTGLPATIAVADLNGDGFPDLVSGSASSGPQVYLGYGDGTFHAAGSPLGTGIWTGSAVVGDFNRDGIPDLAIVAGYYSPLYIFLGKGDGTFTALPVNSSVTVNEPGTIVATDLNHDGKVDLVLSNWNSYSGNTQNPDLTAFLGNGDGTFTAIPGDTQLSQTWSLIAADVNGDGTPDLVVGTATGISVLLTKPTQTATVSASGISPTGPAPHLVAAAYSGDSNYSGSTSGTTSLNVQVATPVFSLANGVYTSEQTLSITDATPGVTIYYQLTGGSQTTGGYAPYTGPVSLASQGTFQVWAYASATGYQQSATAQAIYTLNLPPAPAPVFSLAAGVYPGAQTLTISDSAPSVSIYYTTNGWAPSPQSTLYTGPITISTSETVVAYAVNGGYSSSPRTLAQYIIANAASSFIYTIAGNGTYGESGDGGPATAATLNHAMGIALDSAGNEYIADIYNHVIRRIDATSGTITTIAGNEIGGYSGDNGPATAAELLDPTGVAIDTAGNVYIADSGNNVVRRVAASTGTIGTFAGTGASNPSGGISGDNGLATGAPLDWPNGVAVDNAGNVYIADTLDCAIRKVNASSGIITTVAGNGTCGYSGDNGPAVAATFWQPTGVAVDSAGNLYIADSQNNVVRKVSAGTGIVTTVAGKGYVYNGTSYSGDGGPATNAQLRYPYAVTVDSAGNLFIADAGNNAIREVYASTGIIATLAGGASACGTLSGDGGPASNAGVCNPRGVTVAPSGNVFVADSGYNRIRLVTAQALPPSATTAAPVFSVSAGTYAGPQTLTITDATPGAEIYLTLDGSAPSTLTLSYRGPLNINGSITVQAIAVAPGYLPSPPVSATYTITANPPAVVNTIAGTGTVGFSGSGGPALSAYISWPEGEAVDASGNLYIADYYNCAVWQLSSSTGNISVVAGTGQCGSAGVGGAATSAQLLQPSHVAVDGAGNLYISDTGNNRIVKVTASTGIMTLYAGNGRGPGYPEGDGGPATSATTYNPQGIAVDASGNLYVAEPWAGKVRMVSAATGIIVTAAGGGSAALTGGQAPTAVRLSPVDVAVDAAGDLYIGEYSRVSMVSAATGLISPIAGNGDEGTSGDGLAPLQAEIDVQSIALDSAANVYVSGPGGTVRMIPSGGGPITTIAGNGYGALGAEGISATLSGLASPAGLAFDSTGALYIGDSFNHRVRKVTFPGTTADPAFSVAPGVYSTSQTLTITDNTTGATIYYTTDGQTPTTASTTYSGPITIAATETVKAIAIAPGLTASSVVSADYQIGPPVAPAITWSTPNAIFYGTALSGAQLDATATVLGTFAYNPPAGTLLTAGSHLLTATFTPANAQRYTTSTATVTLVVNPAVPVVTWSNPASLTYGTALSAAQLNALASVQGTFSYSPAAGTVLSVGVHALTATFTPTDATNYSTVNVSVSITVNAAVPQITWAAPAAIVYGTALGATQLDATASVPGSFTYSPAAGTVPGAGAVTLTASFAPSDTANYASTTATVQLTVTKATPSVAWATPAAIVYGTPLGSAQLNATASIPGTFAYSPAAGAVLQVGTQVLSANFTPSDAADYNNASATVTLSVVNPVPAVSGLSPAYLAAGGTGFSLTVNGAGFMPSSTVFWGTTALATQYASPSQLTAQVPASAIASSGTASVTVQTGTPGGGSSSSVVFEVDSPGSSGASTPVFPTASASVHPGSTATYSVTLPPSVMSATATCLNLPAGASCSYSNGTLSVATSAATPQGTYQVTVVFTETLSGAAAAGISLPLLLLPFAQRRRKLRASRVALLVLVAGMVLGCALLPLGCGGGGSSSGSGSNPPPQTHQATSSGTITLTVN